VNFSSSIKSQIEPNKRLVSSKPEKYHELLTEKRLDDPFFRQ